MKKFGKGERQGVKSEWWFEKAWLKFNFHWIAARHTFYRDDLLRMVDGQKILRNRILCPIAERGCAKAFGFTNPSLLFTKPTSLLCNLCSIHFFLPIFLSFFFSSFLNKLLRSKGKWEKKKLKSWNWIPVNSQMNKSKTDIFRFLQI